MSQGVDPLKVHEKHGKVENEDGWIDLGYVDGTPEFTVLQVNLFGDYLVNEAQARGVLDFATRLIAKRPIGPDVPLRSQLAREMRFWLELHIRPGGLDERERTALREIEERVLDLLLAIARDPSAKMP